jgi:hypothetical protein
MIIFKIYFAGGVSLTWDWYFECAVLPPGNNKDAIPLEATVSTIWHFDLKAVDKVFHIKVFPVPP